MLTSTAPVWVKEGADVMPKRLKCIQVSQLSPGNSTLIMGGPEAIALFNVDGNFFACSNACPHAGAPLVQGFIREKTLVCPWHGWSFDLGIESDSLKDGVLRYPVEVEDDTVYIVIPD